MINLCWMTSHGWAQMVRTQDVISQKIPYKISRETLIDALDGKEAQKQIDQYRISKAEAVARISSLTDEEIYAYWVERVKTRKIISPETPPRITRKMLADTLNREEVQKQLEQYGISRVEAAGRINSLTDAEVAAIATEVGPLPSGGDHDDDDAFIFFLQILLIIVFIGVILVAYILGLFVKGIECLFSDCEPKGGASYILRPWWLSADDSFIWTDKGAPDETNDPPTEQIDSGDRLEGRQ